jgi:hypothetical protein
MRILSFVVAFVAGLMLSSPPAGSMEQQTLEIATKKGVHVFSVELAVTDEERQKGLMFRKSLPESYGMLFDFKRDQDVSMSRAKAAIASWMAARSQSPAAGQADAMAILMRRTLKRTIAPILSSLRRMVPQVAVAKSVSCRPIRRRRRAARRPWRRTTGAADWPAWWLSRCGRHRGRAGIP